MTRRPLPLRSYRKAAGHTQASLARVLGCRRETYARIEAGSYPVSERLEGLIARALGLNASDRNIAFGYPNWQPEMDRQPEHATGLAARRLSIVSPVEVAGGSAES